MRIPSPLFSAIGQLRGFDMLLEELQLDDWEKTNTGRNTEYRLVVCPWCTPRIISVGSTADYAYISMHMFQHDLLSQTQPSSSVKQIFTQFPQLFVSLIKTTIDISCLQVIKHSLSFFTSVLWSLCLRQQNLSNISSISKPGKIRKKAALCWYSLPAQLEWCCFHCPPPSWRISFPVRLGLNCFTLLLCVFSLFLLTPSTNCAQQPLGSTTLAIGHLQTMSGFSKLEIVREI